MKSPQIPGQAGTPLRARDPSCGLMQVVGQRSDPPIDEHANLEIMPRDLTNEVNVGPMDDAAEARAFKALNEEWINELFALEPPDRLLIDHPQEEIVAKGGQVLIARLHGEIVGCVALMPMADGVFELSKMAVTPAVRGMGVGRVVLLAAIRSARLLGASSLFLATSTKLTNAINLYESVGFRDVPAERLGPYPYHRADVFMELRLRG